MAPYRSVLNVAEVYDFTVSLHVAVHVSAQLVTLELRGFDYTLLRIVLYPFTHLPEGFNQPSNIPPNSPQLHFDCLNNCRKVHFIAPTSGTSDEILMKDHRSERYIIYRAYTYKCFGVGFKRKPMTLFLSAYRLYHT